MPLKSGKQSNDKYTPLPKKETDDCNQGSLKISLPTSSKYGK